MSDYRIVETTIANNVIVTPNKVVEVDKGETRVVRVSDSVKYTSNKMVFVVGSNSNTPVSTGSKNVVGTRFGDGTVKQWVISTDAPTTLSLRIRRTSSYPSFSDFLALSLVADDYATGTVNMPIQNLDIFTIAVDSNTDATHITVELYIR